MDSARDTLPPDTPLAMEATAPIRRHSTERWLGDSSSDTISQSASDTAVMSSRMTYSVPVCGRATPSTKDAGETPLVSLESGFLRQVLLGTRSWAVSLVLHVVTIVALALLVLDAGQENSLVTLESSESIAALEELGDLSIDLTSFQVPQSSGPAEVAAERPEVSIPATEIPLDSLAPPPTNLLSQFAAGDGEDLMRELSGGGGETSGELGAVEVETGGSRSTFFGIDIVGQKIVYIVDRSGSMEGIRWHAARNELIQSIESLTPDQSFFVFLFSDDSHPMPQLAGRNQLVPATKENIAEVEKWLMRQQPGDWTEPKGCVKRALGMEPDTVFLLTDGMFQDDTVPWLVENAERQQTRTDEKSPVIHTIAFHCEEAQAFLELIANVYKGTFRSVE
jgi:hypothetical protein